MARVTLGLLALIGSLQAAGEAEALDPRTLGDGTSVSAARYPYGVRVATERADETFHHCTGVLIRPTWVLTLAHCIVNDGLGVSSEPVPYGSISVGYDCNPSAPSCEEYKLSSDSP